MSSASAGPMVCGAFQYFFCCACRSRLFSCAADVPVFDTIRPEMSDYEVDVGFSDADMWDDLTPLLVRGEEVLARPPRPPSLEMANDRLARMRGLPTSQAKANPTVEALAPRSNQGEVRPVFSTAKAELDALLAAASTDKRVYDVRLAARDPWHNPHVPRTTPMFRAELRAYLAHTVQWLLTKCPAPYTVAELSLILEFGQILRFQTGKCLGLKASSLFHHACIASGLPELGVKAILDRIHTGVDYSLPICQTLMMALYDKLSSPIPTLLSSLFIEPVPQSPNDHRTNWSAFAKAQLSSAQAQMPEQEDKHKSHDLEFQSPRAKVELALFTAVYRARFQIFLRMRILALLSSLCTSRVMDGMLLACVVGSAMRFLHLEGVLPSSSSFSSGSDAKGPDLLDQELLQSLDETFALLVTSLDRERTMHTVLSHLRKSPTYETHSNEVLDPNLLFFSLHAKPYGVEWARDAGRYYALRRAPFLARSADASEPPSSIAEEMQGDYGNTEGTTAQVPFLPENAPGVSSTFTAYFNTALRSQPAFRAAKEMRQLFTEMGLLGSSHRQVERQRRENARKSKTTTSSKHKTRKPPQATQQASQTSPSISRQNRPPSHDVSTSRRAENVSISTDKSTTSTHSLPSPSAPFDASPKRTRGRPRKTPPPQDISTTTEPTPPPEPPILFPPAPPPEPFRPKESKERDRPRKTPIFRI